MGKVKNVLALGGGVALLVGIGAVAGQKILANVQVELGNPQLDRTPYLMGYVMTDVPITITNNNFFPLGLKYFNGVVSFGAVQLAKINIPIGFSVPPGGVKTITLNMDIPTDRVAEDLGKLLAGGNLFDVILNKIMLNGQLQVQGNFTKIPIPLNNIPIPIV